MADLAKLVVRLEMQSAQLQKGLDEANGKLARFEKSTAAALGRIDKKFRSITGGVKTALGVIAGAVSFREIVQASADAAKNFALLENAVVQAGAAAGGRTAQQFADVSKELQNISTFSDDSIQNVQQLLLRFQNIRTDRFDDATKSVLNLSSALGQDLDSAAKLVGKALSDPEKGMGALAKAGVILSDSQKKVIKTLVDTGKTADAQGVLLDALEKKFGGAAEAARGNFSGALTAVKNSINDLMEVDGGLPGATESLDSLAKVLQDPAVRAGADALFSVLIRGAAALAELLGKTIAGLAILTGNGQDAAVNLDNEIIALSERIDDFKKKNPFPDAFGKEQLEEQTAALKKLTDQYDKLMGLGMAGIGVDQAKAKEKKSSVPGLPDPDAVAEATDAAEKLRAKLEAQGAALTQKLQTPLEQYNAAVAEADRLMAAGVITTDTWARALGAARGELDATTEALINAAEGFTTLEQEIEAGRKKALGDIDAELKAYNDAGIHVIEKQIEAADKKLSVFAEQAARNTQDILADGISSALHDGLEDGAAGMLEAFGNMLEQMTIQAIAADIAGKIFGEDGTGGGWLDKLGGLFGGGGGGSNIVEGEWDWLKGIGSIFGFGGSRDNGGRGHPGEAVMIGVGAQPEMFVPDSAGEFFPAGSMGGGGGVVQNIYTSSPITTRSARQLELEAGKRQRIASARLG